MTTLKPPLSVYVLHHLKSDSGKKVYEHIYKILCRDVEKPLFASRGIPVYLRTDVDSKILPIEFSVSEKTIVFVIVDLYMYSSDKWEEYVKNILEEKKRTDKSVFVLPILLHDYAASFAGMQDLQGIKYSDNDVFRHLLDFEIRIYHFVIKVLTTKISNRLQIFISHAKKDGEDKAEGLRLYLATNSKFDYFFDANNIQDGDDFSKVLNSNAKNSLMVVLNTDAYSGRDWCQREITIAKENDCPVVVVDFIENYVERMYPYLGNVSWIKYTGDWQPIVRLLLQTALQYSYQKAYLNYFCRKNNMQKKNIAILPLVPEILKISKISKNTIIYPEPPLAFSERKILCERYKNKKIITPVENVFSDSGFLHNKSVAISISESDDFAKHGISELMIKDMTIELVRHIFFKGGTLVYGGDLRKNGYTRIFSELARNYIEMNSETKDEYYFYDYIAWPFSLTVSDLDRAEFKYANAKLEEINSPECGISFDSQKFMFPDSVHEKYILSCALSEMRKKRNENTDVLVILGGKVSNPNRVYPGTLEEFLLAVQKRIPVYIIGSFGGMAELICKVLDNEISCTEFCQQIHADDELISFHNEHSDLKISYGNIYKEIQSASEYVNQGLTADEKDILRHSINIFDIVSVVMTGLHWASLKKTGE